MHLRHCTLCLHLWKKESGWDLKTYPQCIVWCSWMNMYCFRSSSVLSRQVLVPPPFETLHTGDKKCGDPSELCNVSTLREKEGWLMAGAAEGKKLVPGVSWLMMAFPNLRKKGEGVRGGNHPFYRIRGRGVLNIILVSTQKLRIVHESVVATLILAFSSIQTSGSMETLQEYTSGSYSWPYSLTPSSKVEQVQKYRTVKPV